MEDAEKDRGMPTLEKIEAERPDASEFCYPDGYMPRGPAHGKSGTKL